MVTIMRGLFNLDHRVYLSCVWNLLNVVTMTLLMSKILLLLCISVLISLDKVAEEYRTTSQYFTHLETIGTQFGIFRDVFEKSFLPKMVATICYGSKYVYHGNILKANEVQTIHRS